MFKEEIDVEKTDRKDYITKRLEDNDLVDLKSDIEDVVAAKINNRVQTKKQEILNKINGIDTEEEQEEE